MTLHGVILGMTREVEATRTKHMGVNQQTLVDLGIYVAQNAEAIAARLKEADRLEHEAVKWRSIADQLAETLTQNGVGGKAWQFALDRYDEASNKQGGAP